MQNKEGEREKEKEKGRKRPTQQKQRDKYGERKKRGKKRGKERGGEEEEERDYHCRKLHLLLDCPHFVIMCDHVCVLVRVKTAYEFPIDWKLRRGGGGSVLVGNIERSSVLTPWDERVDLVSDYFPKL